MGLWAAVGFLPTLTACFINYPWLNVAVIFSNCACFIVLFTFILRYEMQYRRYVNKNYPGVLRNVVKLQPDDEQALYNDKQFQALAQNVTDINRFVLAAIVAIAVVLSKAVGLW